MNSPCFDKVHRDPVDKTAALIFAKGDKFDVKLSNTEKYYSETAPFPFKKYNGQTPSLIGQRFGRLVVIGYLGTNSRRCASWQVRCDCGNYCSKITKSLKAGNSLKCPLCEKAEYLLKPRFNQIDFETKKGEL